MENTNTDQSLFEISLDDNLKQQLRSTASIGGIAAIVSLAGSILGLVLYFVQRQKLSSYSYDSYSSYQVRQAANTGGFVSQAVSIIIAIVFFYLLNKFSRSVKTGLDTNDHYFIGEGLGSLAGYFRFMGVLIIIGITLVCLGVLFALAAGGFGR